MARYPTVGKADLLRALGALGSPAPDAVSPEILDRMASRIGLALREKSLETAATLVLPGGEGQAPGRLETAQDEDRAPSVRRPPLQARFFAVLQREDRQRDQLEAQTGQATDLQPLTLADCLPESAEQAPLPLVRPTRLWPALRPALGVARPGCIDTAVLVRRLARAENIRRLPRRSRLQASGEAWIIADRSKRLLPYATDFRHVVAEVARLQGSAKVRVWNVLETPRAVLSMRRGKHAPKAVHGQIPAPPAGTPVLILSDLAQLAPGRRATDDWIAFCQRMTQAGARPSAWVPMSERLVSRELARQMPVHCLGSGDLHPVKPARCVPEPLPPTVELRALLQRIACCVRVEPALLRALRLLSPETAAEPGLEGLLWSPHPDVRAGYGYCEIQAEAQTRWRQAFAALGASDAGRAEQDETLLRIVSAHLARGRSTESMEILLWETHAGRPAPAGVLAERAAKAHRWLARLGRFPRLAPGDVPAYAQDLFARQGGDAHFMAAHSADLGPLFRLSGAKSIPRGLRTADVLEKGERPPVAYEIVQHGDSLSLSPSNPERALSNPAGLGVPYFDAARKQWIGLARNRVAHSQIEVAGQVEWATSDGRYRLRLDVPDDLRSLPLPMPDGAGELFVLSTPSQTLVLGPLQRPTWAEEWGYVGGVLQARAPSPLGGSLWLDAVPWAPQPWQGHWPLSPRAFQSAAKLLGSATGMTLGADLEFGLYLDLPFGAATQRFRWIEPGEFWMGSPEGEEGRYSHEGPRHVVRLSEGYWLAETACSQAVWLAVMESNPSEFQDDPQNPVEQVSWDEVQAFLRAVEQRLLGVQVALPTEAEWEYACRAGSETAFSWGNGISPEQANYNATISYAGGPTGEWRQKTVPVKRYAPNGWGLYQMHGNVWEWCADGWRAYDGRPQVDPRGPEDSGAEAQRAVRGGSWIFSPHGLRAADRHRRLRDWRYDNLGFRFSLRSTGQPGGAERPPEAALTRDA